MDTSETNFQIQIEKLVYGGEGLARRDGRVILAPFVLPGEGVTVRPLAAKHGVLRAVVASVDAPSADRVNPLCEYFERCGGCHYQHASFEAQVARKVDILRETMARCGVRQDLEIRTLTGEPWGYRNRTQFHVERGRLGYLAAGSHRLVPVSRCPIASPRINEALGVLLDMARDARWPGFLRSIELFTNESEVQINVLDSERPVARRFFDWCSQRITGASDSTLEYAVGEFTYRVGARSFFQVNRFLIGAMVEEAIGAAQGGHALDLYAGVGLFALPLARRFARVTAVEGGAGASRDLEFNARRSGCPIEVSQQQVEVFLAASGEHPDFVLADPPRAGLGKVAVARLIEMRPARLTIVSCDPSTLARDLNALLAAGYRIERMTMADLFPQTYHIETITHLGC